MLPGEDVAPKQAGQRGAEGSTERTVVDAECHAVHSCPERSVANGDTTHYMDLLPLLDDPAQQYRGPNVCPCKL